MEGRKYIGFEVVKEYYDFISKRLESNSYRIKDEKLPMKMSNHLPYFNVFQN